MISERVTRGSKAAQGHHTIFPRFHTSSVALYIQKLEPLGLNLCFHRGNEQPNHSQEAKLFVIIPKTSLRPYSSLD